MGRRRVRGGWESRRGGSQGRLARVGGGRLRRRRKGGLDGVVRWQASGRGGICFRISICAGFLDPAESWTGAFRRVEFVGGWEVRRCG
jgi:hypothetical protein